MTESAAQLLALRHYRTLWLGQVWPAQAVAWDAEYTSVAAGTFTSITVLSNAGDGWSASAQRNFEQGIRLAALQQYRADLDAAYAAEVLAPSGAGVDGPGVMYPVFLSFPH